MKRRLALALLFHTQQPDAQTTVSSDAIEQLLQWPRFAEAGVTWSFPATLLQHPQTPINRTLNLIRSRCRRGLDSLAACGYSGVPHGALLQAELKRELSWTMRNARGDGLGAHFGVELPGFFHASADLARGAALQRYQDSFAFVAAGFDSAGSTPLGELILYGEQRRYRVAGADWTRLQGGLTEAAAARMVRRLARALTRSAKRSPSAVLLIHFGNPQDGLPLRRLQQLLQAVAKRTSLQLVPLSREFVASCDEDHHAAPVIDVVQPDPVTPQLLHAVRRAAQQRHGRQTAEQTHSILSLLCSDIGAEDRAERHAASNADISLDREYIASMMGSATLSEEGITAWFDNGALCRIDSDEYSLLSRRPSLGWIEFRGRRCTMSVESAFSFESRHARGLSTYASLVDPALQQPGSLQMDALFIENSGWLLLDLHFTTPVAASDAPVVRLSPLEIALYECAVGQWIEIESVYPDGSQGAAYIEAGNKPARSTIWGSLFRIRWQDRVVSLGYPALSGPIVAPLTVEVTPAGKRCCRIGVHVAGCLERPDLSRASQQRVTLCLAPGEPDTDIVSTPPERLRAALLQPKQPG